MWEKSSVEVAELFFFLKKNKKIAASLLPNGRMPSRPTRPAWPSRLGLLSLARLGLLGLLWQNAWVTLTALQIIYSIICQRVIVSYHCSAYGYALIYRSTLFQRYTSRYLDISVHIPYYCWEI